MSNIGRAREMAKRGRKYREDREIELYGEPVTLQYRPLVDDEFLPITAFIVDHFDLEDEDIRGEDSIDKVREEIDEARDDEGMVRASKLDEDFVKTIQTAAILSLTADYDEDGNRKPFADEGEDSAREFVEGLHGGYSVEIGYEALEISGDIREAEKFRGGRGGV